MNRYYCTNIGVISAILVIAAALVITSFQRAEAFIMPVEDRTGGRKAAGTNSYFR
jgi:hypothetical protein